MRNEQSIINRLQQIMQDDRISYYNLALDIGVSNSVLYNIVKRGVRITPEVHNKLQAFLDNYETKSEQIARLQRECDILDGIIDVNNAKIGQLEKEIKELSHYLACMTEQRNKLDTFLQEIKGIVTALYMNEWLQRNETARQSIQLLQEKIAECEVNE